MIHKARTKALSWLLSLALMLSLVPGISIPAYADGTDVETPLTLEAITAGTIQVSSPKKDMQYTLNGGEKTKVTSTSTITIDVAVGDKVAFYGNGTEITQYSSGWFGTRISGGTAECYVYGNVMSLVDETGFATANELSAVNTFSSLFNGNKNIYTHNSRKIVLPATTLAKNCYQTMFQGCTGLTVAPELPATTLADSCYSSMFSGCTGLTAAPTLPATTLAKSCYQSMFFGCTGLTVAPNLPASTLMEQCYSNMFKDCTNLTAAPALPATTLAKSCYQSMFFGCTGLTVAPNLSAAALVSGCYSYMFQDCTNLTTAPALPASTLKNQCYEYMFSGCTSLTAAPELPATTLADSCYSSMFSGCTSLIAAPVLPATTLASNCYHNMFSGCTSLTAAPVLPVTTLANGCYSGMFSDCTGLTAAPVLPATTLASNCYQNMFSGCTSLTAAPKLPVTTLANGCYRGMFKGCTSLTAAPNLPATAMATQCYNDMFKDCTSLTAAPELPAVTLANYCYSGMFSGCTSLTAAPELPAVTLANYCYSGMFSGCTSLTAAPKLPVTKLAISCYEELFKDCTGLTAAPVLPATTLASSCYQNMFSGCTSLTAAPELPVTTLANGCYFGMFSGCTGLTAAPVLPATTLTASCYKGMFSDCIGLSAAPELPAATLASNCYQNMFSGCTSLTAVICLATDISALYSTDNWLNGVAANGTFTKAPTMTSWATGANGIPSGWTVRVLHAHSFTYAADGAMITATCSAEDCPLPEADGNHVATLTISEPTESDGKATLTESVDGTFDLTALQSNVQYSNTKTDGVWTGYQGNPFTEQGFFNAKIKLDNAVASVTYGMSCITYDAQTAHGTVSGPSGATVDATITPVLTPEDGYELDTLTVTPAAGSGITGVTVNGGTFVMPEANVTVSATFKLKPFNIISGLEAGATMTAKVGENEVTTAKMGDTVALTITPAAGYTVNTVSLNDEVVSGTGNTRTFTMPASNVTVTATYNAINYTVTVNTAEHGSVSAKIGENDASTANMGNTVTLTTTPDDGYSTDSVSVTYGENATVSVAKTGDNTYTFEMPANAVTVSATFTAIDYTVTVNQAANGAVRASKTSGVHVGDEISLAITPNAGYALNTITVTGASSNSVPVTDGKFTMPASDVTVTAAFDELTAYTIFYRASGTPDSVKFRTTGSGAGSNMTNSAKLGNIDCWAIQISAAKDKATFSVAFQEGDGVWGSLTARNVVSDIPNDLAAGSAVIVKGEAKAFIVSFLWGDIAVDNSTGSYQTVSGGSKNFLVTNNTTSVSVSDPTKTGYTFLGWDDGKSSSLKQSSNGTVNISGINENTIFAARWRINTSTVTYNLNGGSGNAPKATVNYGGKITAPANPTREGYAFVHWVVASNTTQQIGGQARRLSAGTAFDFNNTEIINNLTLKAEWKHVHSYVCLPLDHAAFDGAFADYYDYKGQLHIKICTSMDDYSVEAHRFVNGKCACGASIFDNKVTLTKIIDNESSTMQAIQNSVVSISAPSTKNSKQFTKWQYSTDGSNWSDLTANPYVAFTIPSNLQAKAVYNGSEVKQTVESFLYNGNLAFQFTYSVPKDMTVVDAGLLIGNNSHIGYMNAKQLTANVSGMSDLMFPYIPEVEMPIHYDPATDDAVAKFGAQKVAQKMFREEALNVSGKSNPIFKKCAVLGKTGTAALAINTSANNIYYYGMGYVICKNSSGNLVVFMTNAISATKGNPNHTASSTNPVQ